jgi:hypothetical protein
MSYRYYADLSFRGTVVLDEKSALNKRLKSRRSSAIMKTAAKVAVMLIVMTLLIAKPVTASAQARVDLEDLSVKGELLNDNRMRMTSRESASIQDRVKYRKNFRSEIIDGSDVRVPAAEVLDEVEGK